jgi:hypothetical protein
MRRVTDRVEAWHKGHLMGVRTPSPLLPFFAIALKGAVSFSEPPCHSTFSLAATLMDLWQLPSVLRTPVLVMDEINVNGRHHRLSPAWSFEEGVEVVI